MTFKKQNIECLSTSGKQIKLIKCMLLVSSIACSINAKAEILIPNPLIKPAQITPITTGAGEGQISPNQNDKRNPMNPRSLPGSTANLPILPSVDGEADSNASLGFVSSSTLRSQLSQYKVTVIAGDRAVLQFGIASTQGAAAASGSQSIQPNQNSNSGTSSVKIQAPQMLHLKNGFTTLFSGIPVKALINNNIVEIYKQKTEKSDKKKSSNSVSSYAEEDLVFSGTLDFSSITPYVPDVSKLEKIDSTYKKSVTPDETKSRSQSSGSPSGSSGGYGSPQQPPPM